jgi:murein DD-endopeptidase MepM/ murein hydrolase activator NlpD
MLAGAISLPPAFAGPRDKDLKQEKNKVDAKVEGAHNDLEHSSAALQQAAAALSAAQAQLDTAQAHLAKTRGELAAAEALDRQMQAKLDAAIAKLEKARADLEAGHVKVAEQEQELGRIVVANYQTGDPALMGLSMVLTSQDPSELTGQLNSVQNVMDKEDATLSRLEASKILLAVQEQEVEDAKDEVAVQRQAAAENLVKKQELEKQAAAAELQVQNLVSLRAEAEDKAEEARQADLATLQSLEKEQDRIAEILKKRAEAARRRAAAAAAAANGAGVGPLHSNGFLDYPVPGNVTSPYGWRRHPIFGYKSLHDGIDFGAGCGTPIRAPAAGRVLQEYFQSAWGNRIIIDHGFHKGAGLATISNHLSGYAVNEGDWVERGQVIGFVGNTGWSTGCHLHFTVMQNGSPTNPMNWL